MTIRRALFPLVLLLAFLAPFIFPAELVAYPLLVLWAVDAFRSRRWPSALSSWPGLLAALLGTLVVVSTIFSRDPIRSTRHVGGVTLLLLLPLAIDELTDARRGRKLFLALGASGVAIALVGLWQFGHGGDDLGNRIQGTLSHYMTFSGLGVLWSGVLLGIAFEERGQPRWAGFAAAIPLLATLLTFTRNAYLGLAATLVFYFVWRRPRALLVLAAVLVAVFFLLPPEIRDRIRSIGDFSDPSNRDRLAMVHAGARMIEDSPVTGLGPEMVKRYYVLYRDADAPRWRVPHLHDNALQFAAANGILAGAAYLALALLVIVRAALRLRTERRPGPAALLAGALLASVALFVAGFFEYNFGDTEVEIATLLVWAIPFSAATAPADPSH